MMIMKIKIRAAFLLVLLVLTLAACSRKTPVAVRVGEQQLTMDELATLFRNSPHYIRAHEFSAERLNEFVEKEVVDDLLFQQQGYRLGLDQDSLLLKRIDYLTRDLLTREDGLLYKTILPDSFVVSESEIEQAYRLQGVHRQLAHILVHRRETADSLIERLKAGADFADLARRYSMDSQSADREGVLLRPVVWGNVQAPVDSIIFSKAVGEIVDPIRSPAGYHIFKTLQENERPQRPLPQERERLRKVLQDRKKKSFMQSYLQKLYMENQVAYNDSLLLRLLDLYEEQPVVQRLLHHERLTQSEREQVIASSVDDRIMLDEIVQSYIAPPPGMRQPWHNIEDVRDFINGQLSTRLLYRQAVEMGLDRHQETVARIDEYRNRLVQQQAREKLVINQLVIDPQEIEEHVQQEIAQGRLTDEEEARMLRRRSLRRQKAEELTVKLLAQWRETEKISVDDCVLQRLAEQLTAEKKRLN
ncbi:MAG TPA: peptidylprolyl isomerase [bacterium]|nr:peptidylprolyl isomerase [bacterium]